MLKGPLYVGVCVWCFINIFAYFLQETRLYRIHSLLALKVVVMISLVVVCVN